ncbi:MAG: EAL domain-containing protein [Fibrobacterales bacterium]
MKREKRTSLLKGLFAHFLQFNQMALALLIFIAVFFIASKVNSFNYQQYLKESSLIQSFYFKAYILNNALENDIDITLDILEKLPNQETDIEHHLFLVEPTGAIDITGDKPPQYLPTTTPPYSEFYLQIKNTTIDSLINFPSMRMLQYHFNDKRSKLALILPNRSPIALFLAEYGLNLTIMIFGLSVIFLLFYIFTKNHLIKPITILAKHIQSLKDNFVDSQNLQDQVPKNWRPLLGIITQTFKKNRRYQQDLINQFYLDTLTALPNRNKLHYDIDKTAFDELYLILLDVDSFKDINDFYGTSTGDSVLIQIKELLLNQINNQQWNLYRTSGDEFAILSHTQVEGQDALAWLEKFLTITQNTIFKYQNYKIRIRFSLGVAIGKENILRKADMALHEAKSKRKHYVIYNNATIPQGEFEENIKWTNTICHALENQNFVPYFQPIYNNRSHAIEKYECLIRLIDEAGEVVAPINFLPIAIKNKQYNLLSKIMIEKSFARFAGTKFEFSVNLSADDMLNEETTRFIFEQLRHHNIGHQVVFEILESDGIENYSEVKTFIRQAKEFGCKIAIDDFGTGYSNFEHILRLDIDYIKIDGSLIRNIENDKNLKILLETIVDFAKKLGIELIAEFVSSEGIQQEVQELGIEFSQGYYFGKPEPFLLKG